VLANAPTKEGTVPSADIDRALRMKLLYEAAPARHTYVEEFA
jgi:hypothetical protein